MHFEICFGPSRNLVGFGGDRCTAQGFLVPDFWGSGVAKLSQKQLKFNAKISFNCNHSLDHVLLAFYIDFEWISQPWRGGLTSVPYGK